MAKARKILLQSYACIALITFGAAANRHSRDAWAEYSVCQSVQIDNERDSECWKPSSVGNAFFGFVSGVFWPLYGSWLVAEYLGEGNG